MELGALQRLDLSTIEEPSDIKIEKYYRLAEFLDYRMHMTVT